MDFIFMILVYFFSIIIHELGHIVYYWGVFKDWPHVRLRKTNIQIVPNVAMTNVQKSMFLASGIIVGMFSLYPFFYIKPMETTAVMIAYLASSGMDFYTLIIIHLKTEGGVEK
jgi:hypothetical protein